MSSSSPENRLLQALPSDAYAALARDLDAVRLRVRQVLYEPGDPIDHVYFPQGAVISLVSTMQNGASAEIALVGHEGVVGLPAFIGRGPSPTQAIVQIEGTAFRIPAVALRKARDRSATLRDLFNLYTHERLIQISQISACNRLHHVEARLARWLLSIHDRVKTNEFRLTQEFMAHMLGTRRPTLTAAMLGFYHDGLIEYHQRVVTIVDRRGLEATACECYDLLRKEFDRPLRVAGSTLDQDRPVRRRENAVETLREIAGRLMIASIREQEAREEAEAATRAKDRFLSALSVELRRSVTAIVDWSRILAGPHSAKLSRRGLETIDRTARAQLDLVDDLLDISRLAAGTLRIDPRPVDFGEVVAAAVASTRLAAEDRGIELRAAMDQRVEHVWGDADRLKRIVQHLLTNAMAATPEHGRVDVRLDVLGSRVRLTISDMGHRTGNDQIDELGLVIARQFVEPLGGTVRVDTTGSGTTCTVDLPVARRQPSEPTALAADWE